MFLYRRIIRVGMLGALLSGTTRPIWAASCTAPQPLQAANRAHPSAQAYIDLGKWFDQKGQAACAVESYRTALKIDPHSRIALDKIAAALIAGGNYTAAIGLLRSAPRDEALTIDLASAYLKAGRADQASQTLIKAVRATPSSAQLTNALVIFLANHEHLEDAYRLAESFYEKHPHDLDATKLYLRVLVATNDSAKARPLARRQLSAAPHDGELLYLNGVLESKAGEFAMARDHLQQAIELNPDFSESRYNLGLVLARMQDPAGAKGQLEKAIDLGAAEPEAHLELSKVLRTLGDTQGAQAQLTLYQNAIKTNTDRAMSNSKSAQATQELTNGDPRKAVALYQEALEATPHDAVLNYKLALALDRAGDIAAERTALEQALQNDPNLAVAQHQLGYLYYRSGDFDSAEQHFRLAVSADPDFAHAWISLAATLATKSRPSEAQEALAHALRLEPQNAEALEMKKELIAAQPAR